MCVCVGHTIGCICLQVYTQRDLHARTVKSSAWKFLKINCTEHYLWGGFNASAPLILIIQIGFSGCVACLCCVYNIFAQTQQTRMIKTILLSISIGMSYCVVMQVIHEAPHVYQHRVHIYKTQRMERRMMQICQKHNGQQKLVSKTANSEIKRIKCL